MYESERIYRTNKEKPKASSFLWRLWRKKTQYYEGELRCPIFDNEIVKYGWDVAWDRHCRDVGKSEDCGDLRDLAIWEFIEELENA